MNTLITNQTTQDLLHIAQSIAKENYNEHYGAPHLLQALVHKNVGLLDFMRNLSKEPGYFYEWADVRIEEYPKTSLLPSEIQADN